METREFRSKSVARLAKAGIVVSTGLPLIDNFSVRPLPEILDRIICLNAVAAAAHGFPKESALAWLSKEGTLENLTSEECLFLTSNGEGTDEFKVQVEGIWALAWILGMVSDFDFWRECDPRFVTILPDLRTAENSAIFRARAHLRSEAEIGIEVDLAYCLHWIVRNAGVNGKHVPAGIIPYIVRERRRALEWAIGGEAWDRVPLDT